MEIYSKWGAGLVPSIFTLCDLTKLIILSAVFMWLFEFVLYLIRFVLATRMHGVPFACIKLSDCKICLGVCMLYRSSNYPGDRPAVHVR